MKLTLAQLSEDQRADSFSLSFLFSFLKLLWLNKQRIICFLAQIIIKEKEGKEKESRDAERKTGQKQDLILNEL